MIEALIHHNLNVMHIKKNVFHNLFYIVMNVKGKTKDKENASRDFQLLCSRKDLHLIEHVNGRIKMAKEKYALDKNQIKAACE